MQIEIIKHAKQNGENKLGSLNIGTKDWESFN